MTVPADVAVTGLTGLTELDVRARIDAGQVIRSRRRPGAAWPRSCGPTC
jgi:hypothetical protein